MGFDSRKSWRIEQVFLLVVVAAAAAYNRSLNETTVFSDDFVTFFESDAKQIPPHVIFG